MTFFYHQLLCLVCSIFFLAACDLQKKEMPSNRQIESAFFYSDFVFLTEVSGIKCKSSTECRYYFKVKNVIKGNSSYKGEEYYIDGEFENEYGHLMFGLLSEAGNLEYTVINKGDKALLVLEKVDENSKQAFPFKVHRVPDPRSLDDFGKIFLALRWNWGVETFECWISNQKESGYRPPEFIGDLLGSGSDFEKSIYEISDFWTVTFFETTRYCLENLKCSGIQGKMRIDKVLKGQNNKIEKSIFQFVVDKDPIPRFYSELLLKKTETLLLGFSTSPKEANFGRIKLVDKNGNLIERYLRIPLKGQNAELILKVHTMKNYVPPLNADEDEFSSKKKKYLFPLPSGRGSSSN